MINRTRRRDFLRLASVGAASISLSSENLQAQLHPARTLGLLNVREFGATGDGHTLDHSSINRAIEEASKNGGGTVHIPAGNYLCYTLRLKSNVALFIDQGATIIGADTPMDGFRRAVGEGTMRQSREILPRISKTLVITTGTTA